MMRRTGAGHGARAHQPISEPPGRLPRALTRLGVVFATSVVEHDQVPRQRPRPYAWYTASTAR